MTKDTSQTRGSQPETGRLLAKRNEKWCKLTLHQISLSFSSYTVPLKFPRTLSDPAEIIHKRFNEECNKDEYYVHYDGCDRRLDQWLPPEQ